MIVGLGVDLVSIDRIRKAMERPGFVERILTASELEKAPSPLTAVFVSGRWAAKEAVAKALGANLRWHDVEIVRDDYGKPELIVNSPVFVDFSLFLSISHERTHTVAVVVAERP